MALLEHMPPVGGFTCDRNLNQPNPLIWNAGIPTNISLTDQSDLCDLVMSQQNRYNDLHSIPQPPRQKTRNNLELHPEQLDNHWLNALGTLKQKTMYSVRTPDMARTEASQVDFLSLGGKPSPPALPSSSMDHTLFSHGVVGGQRSSNRPPTNLSSRERDAGMSKWAHDGFPFPHTTASSTGHSRSLTCPSFPTAPRDLWQECFDTHPQSSATCFSSPQSCGMTLSPPSHMRHNICGLPSAGFPGHELTTKPSGPQHTSGYDAGSFDSALWPLTQELQQTHIHSSQESSWLGMDLGLEDVAYTTSQLVGLPSLGDTAPFTLANRTANHESRSGQAFGHGNKQGYQDKDYFARRSDTQSCPVPSSISTDSFDLNQFSGANSTVCPSMEDQDAVYAMLWNDEIDLDTSHACLGSTETSSLAASQQYSTPRNAMTSFSMTSYPKAMPMHRRHASDVRYDTADSECELARPPPGSPPSPNIAAITRRDRSSSRRGTSTRKRHAYQRHTRRERMMDYGAFVIYTPQDRNKILSAVDPSGSFKTKARRDRETEMQRKRVKQAAVRAVVEAGGDLECLRSEGLLT